MFEVPFPPNNNFVGREDILAEIKSTIHENREINGCIPTVLKGLGGMGKSQLMLKYCYLHRNEYEDIIWINAEGRLATLEEFQTLAENIGIKVNNNETLPKHI